MESYWRGSSNTCKKKAVWRAENSTIGKQEQQQNARQCRESKTVIATGWKQTWDSLNIVIRSMVIWLKRCEPMPSNSRTVNCASATEWIALKPKPNKSHWKRALGSDLISASTWLKRCEPMPSDSRIVNCASATNWIALKPKPNESHWKGALGSNLIPWSKM